MAHTSTCLDNVDGPCDCGFEEILEDEAAEIAAELLTCFVCVDIAEE